MSASSASRRAKVSEVMTAGVPVSEWQLIDEMIEFGIQLDVALRVAPAMLPLFNDPRGLAVSFSEAAPLLANKIGVVQIH